MPSADFRILVSSPLDVLSLSAICGPPWVSYCTFTLMPAWFTSAPSGQVSDFEYLGLLIRDFRLISDFCSSGQRFAAASFRFGLTTDTLALWLIVPPDGPIEDFHLQVQQHAKHTQ